MEWFTVILSGLLTIISPVGLVLDTVVADRIRSQVADVEQLAVRIDNVPTYQVLAGKVNRIRIASRGIYPIEGLRINTLELETDALDVDLQRLQKGDNNAPTESLRHPAQLGVRLVLTQKDLNLALESESIKSRLQNIINGFLPKGEDIAIKPFELLKAQIEIVEPDRLRIQVQVKQSGANQSQPLDVVLEAGVKIVSGRIVQLVEPSGSINDRKLSRRLLNGFAEGLSERLNLGVLEKRGITARILHFNVEKQELHVASFIQVNPPPKGERGKNE